MKRVNETRKPTYSFKNFYVRSQIDLHVECFFSCSFVYFDLHSAQTLLPVLHCPANVIPSK